MRRNKIERSKKFLSVPDFDTSPEILKALRKISEEEPKLIKNLFSDKPEFIEIRNELFSDRQKFKGFKMIKNTILQGDCLKILKTLPDKSIDLIFADLPYWMKVDGILKRPEGENFSGCDDKRDNNFLNIDDYSQFTEKWFK